MMEWEGLTIEGAGYQPHTKFFDATGVFDKADIGIFHQTVAGSRTSTDFVLEEGINPAWLTDRYRLSIVGHVHHPQQVDGLNEQTVLVPGSPEQHNFGDQGERGWWLVELPPKGKPKIEIEGQGKLF